MQHHMVEKSGIVSALRLAAFSAQLLWSSERSVTNLPVVCWSLLSNLSVAQQQLEWLWQVFL